MVVVVVVVVVTVVVVVAVVVVVRPHRSSRWTRPIVTDGLVWSEPYTKMAEPIMMPFGILSRDDPGNPVLNGDPDLHT